MLLCIVDSKPCDSNPCLHSGTCTNGAVKGYTCKCSAGYTGPICEHSMYDTITETKRCEDDI